MNYIFILDDFCLSHVYKYLDQKSQIKMTETCHKFLKLRDCVDIIHASTTMTDKQLRLYKNLSVLALFC
jgi:hypothetical protein